MLNIPKEALKRIKYAKNSNSTSLDLSGFNLNEIPEDVYDLISLKELFLYKNQLTEIPESITNLINLKELNLHSNQLTVIPESITKLINLNELDLRFNQLTEIPEFITNLINLNGLNLVGNHIAEIPEFIANLKNLNKLNLDHNQLSKIPESIINLINLKELNLGNNNLIEIPESINGLINLIRLDIDNNQLTKFPESITKLKNLSTLWLSGIDLTEFPESIAKLIKLKTLYLDNNHFTEIPESITKLVNLNTLHLGFNQLSTFPESITKLVNLNILHLNNNQLTEIPESITKLINLNWLYLSNNQLTKITESITNLINLKELYLGGNQLTKIPESISKLINLNGLYLNDNQLTKIPESISNLINLKSLKLDGNPLETPPLEICENGIEAIRDYYRQLDKGKDFIYEAKLIIVGEPGAGKTSLARKIKNPDCDLPEEEETTRGIDIETWEFPFDDKKKFTANLWDFGGQQIYHETHQYFLTKRSFYAMVVDTRKEDTDFDYWLNIVSLYSGNSPLIIIKNEKSDRKREINEKSLKSKYGNLKDIFETNFKDNRGLSKIINAIQFHMSNLPHVGSSLPKTWVDVRKFLETLGEDYISLDKYFNICEDNGFTKEKDKLQLSGYLHDLGVILHFQEDNILKNTVILNPEWGTDAVYCILDNNDVIKNHGFFTSADLPVIWAEKKYKGMESELLRMMLKFKLCYLITRTDDNYIIPQLLTEEQPDYDWDSENNLVMRYRYPDFMPRGIITHLIVGMHRWIADKGNCVWKSGVILETDGAKAEIIEDYGKRNIVIRVSGEKAYKKALMTRVSWEIDEINDSFKGLNFNKLIPCNCDLCRPSNDPHFYKNSNLMNRINKNRYDVECEKSFDRVDIIKLIDDILSLDHDRKDEWKDMKEKPREGRYINIVGDVGKIVYQSGGGNKYLGNTKTSFIQNNITGMHEVIEKNQGLSDEDKKSIKVDVEKIITELIEEDRVPEKKLAEVVTKEPKLKDRFMNLITGASGNLLAQGVTEVIKRVIENPQVFM